MRRGVSTTFTFTKDLKLFIKAHINNMNMEILLCNIKDDSDGPEIDKFNFRHDADGLEVDGHSQSEFNIQGKSESHFMGGSSFLHNNK